MQNRIQTKLKLSQLKLNTFWKREFKIKDLFETSTILHHLNEMTVNVIWTRMRDRLTNISFTTRVPLGIKYPCHIFAIFVV